MNTADGVLTHELFTEQVGRTPDRTAVVAGRRRVSYRELDELANGFAQRLVAEGVSPGDLVGVCLDRDEQLIAALLGVFKAGAAYVPLDPAYPAERLRFITEDADLKRVVVAEARLPLAAAMGAAAVLVEDVVPAEKPPQVPVAPEGTAYVIYTSGSTGLPKGVVVEHRNTANFLRWAAGTLDEADLAGMLFGVSVSFDVSVMEIFTPLVAGGTVIVAGSLLDLATLAARDEVTMISGPPSAIRAVLHHGLPAGVRTVCPAGEALPSGLVAALFAQPGVERVINGYGPTEATTLSHFHTMTRDSFTDSGDAPPIGVGVAGAEGLVLDAAGRPVADGEVGELWIGGPGVARGYLGRPELTAERFVADPDAPGGRRYRTGDLAWRVGDLFHYAGRVDDQVKIRGFRVELGEVEVALAAHPQVRGAVAVAPADADGVRTLYGYVETASADLTEEALRAHLAERLPAYLVPTRVGVLDALPLGPNGKADRSALPALAPAVSGYEHVEPRDEREKLIAEVFADILGTAGVGVHDDFFALGGHSLSGALAVARISAGIGAAVPLAWLIAEPTVAALARRVETGAEPAARPERHPGVDTFPMVGMQWNLWMTPQLAPGSTTTIGLEMRLSGLTGAAGVQSALDGIVRRHEVLRTNTVVQAEWPMAVVNAAAPVPLTELDFRATAGTAPDVDEAIAAAVKHVFDIAHEVPLLRATLIWTGADTAILALAVDHFGFDGYSIGLFAEELATGIAAAQAGEPDPTPEPELQVGDVGIFQMALAQSPGMEAMREFWRAELKGANSPNLPGTLRDSWPVHGKRVVHRLGAGAEARLRALEAACGATRHTVFAAALGVVLRTATDCPDNLVGSVIALRDRPGLDRVIGPLIDMIPVRVKVGDGVSFRGLAASTAAAARRSLANQDLGIAGIMQCGNPDQPPGLPLTPIVLAMQPATVPVVVDRGTVRVELAGEVDPGGAMCDIAVLVNDTADGLQIQLMYDTDRFEQPEVDLFMRRLVHVLDSATADPDQPVAGYGMHALV